MYHKNPQFNLWSFHSFSLEKSNKICNVWSISVDTEWLVSSWSEIKNVCMNLSSAEAWDSWFPVKTNIEFLNTNLTFYFFVKYITKK